MSITRHAGLGARTGDLGMIAFGTVSGGAGASLTGGNFWQGALTGLVVSGLNHAMHKMQERRTLLSRFKNRSFAFQKADVSDGGIDKLHQNVDGLEQAHKEGGSPRHTFDLAGNDFEAVTEEGVVNLNRGLLSKYNNLHFTRSAKSPDFVATKVYKEVGFVKSVASSRKVVKLCISCNV